MEGLDQRQKSVFQFVGKLMLSVNQSIIGQPKIGILNSFWVMHLNRKNLFPNDHDSEIKSFRNSFLEEVGCDTHPFHQSCIGEILMAHATSIQHTMILLIVFGRSTTNRLDNDI